MNTNTNNNHRLRIWSYVCALCAIILSFGFWTWTVTEWYLLTLDTTITVQEVSLIDEDQKTIPLAASLIDTEESYHNAAPIAEAVKEVVEQIENTELQEWGLSPVYTVSIPKIGLRTLVYKPSRIYWDKREWNLMEDQMQVGLSYGAVAYPHSVNPGRRGNVIIAGHSSPPDERAEKSEFGWLFRKLPELEEGDTISITQGEHFVDYTVESIAIVQPSATEILEQQSKKSVIKLITCYPIGTTKERWVVTAVQTNAG